MAARYWVGGAGTWSSANTTNWSATSGGAGGASVPTSADTPIFDANSGSGIVTFTNGGVTVSVITIDNIGIELSLGAAILSSGSITLTSGTFTTNNYNVTATSFSSNNSNTRTINLGSSTVTLNGTGGGVSFTTSTNLTFNAGTSSIICSGSSGIVFNSGGQTFYNVSFTNVSVSSVSLTQEGTYNNLSFVGRTTAGIYSVILSADQTVNGTLTLNGGTTAVMRTFVRSSVIGTARTISCAAIVLQDIDFRNIAFTGGAVPVNGSGTRRLGDCKGNSGITFPAAKTVYWNLSSSSNWSATGWATSAGGTPAANNFPLAQDTVIFTSTSPVSGSTITISSSYNIGTIDMSARTTNTMSLSVGSACAVYGNWINGTGITLSGANTMTFAGQSSQSITSAGITFGLLVTINSPGGSVSLQDAFSTNLSTSGFLTISAGTFDANGYNLTSTGTNGTIVSVTTSTRTIAIGSGTWTIAGTGTVWNVSATGLTVTGAGTISFTSSSVKTFAGGGIQTYPTINQGGTGGLTISGSNKFADITNTALGAVLFTGGTTNEFGAFNLNGTSTAARLTIGSTNTTQVTLKKPTAWNVGTGSLDGGNNIGLSFTAGTNDFLSISRVTGVVSASGILVYISEAATSADTQSSLATFGRSVSESVTVTDAPAARAVYLGLLSESAVSSEAAAAAQAYFASITESVIAADSLGTSFAFYAALAEQAAGSDRADPNLIMSSAVAEILAAADSVSGSRVLLSGISETASAQEANRIGLVFHPVIFESAQSTELSAVASSVFAVFALEAVQSSDGVNPAGSIYNAALPVEGATAADFLAATYLWNPIDDTQTANWQNVNSTQTPGWTQVNDEQTPVWVVIPT